jgi:hypothetical protein
LSTGQGDGAASSYGRADVRTAPTAQQDDEPLVAAEHEVIWQCPPANSMQILQCATDLTEKTIAQLSDRMLRTGCPEEGRPVTRGARLLNSDWGNNVG